MSVTKRCRRCSGFSIVELMVALTISLLLMTGVITVVINSNRSYEALHQTSQQLENGRFAMQLLMEDIRHAGFFGELAALPPFPAAANNVNSCGTADAGSLATAMAVPIQVFNAASGNVTDGAGNVCINASDYVHGTDVLLIRRASTEVTLPTSLNANTFYLAATAFGQTSAIAPGSSGDLILDQWSSVGGTAPIRRYVVHAYFISPCSRGSGTGGACQASDDGGNPIPTLKRLELTDNTMQIVPLVEGIEDLRVEFGIDRTGDGIPDVTYVRNPPWNDVENIVTARIHLLARNLRPTPGYDNETTYNLGLAGTRTFDDDFQRRLFIQTVRAVNLSSRRAQ